MNYKHLAVISPLIIIMCSSFLFIGDIDISLISFTCDDYGPYNGTEGEQIFNITYTYRKNTSYLNVYEALEARCNGRIVSRDYTDYHPLLRGNTYNLSLSFYPTEFQYSRVIDVSFFIIDDRTHTTIYSKIYYLYKKESLNIRPFDDDIYFYETNESTLSIANEKCISEKIDFINTSNVFSNTNYYEIKLDAQSFNYIYPKPFKYGNAYLVFTDPNNLFPNLTKNPRGQIRIPLSLTQSSKKINLRINCDLYVEPRTLTLSSTRRKGFIDTTRFYVPIGKKDLLDGHKFTVEINNVGCNESNIRLSLTYYADRYLFGYCHNSDYCITGEDE